MKTRLFFTVLRKIKYLALWASHVRTVTSHVTHRLLHGVYSAFNTLFPSLLFTLGITIHARDCVITTRQKIQLGT